MSRNNGGPSFKKKFVGLIRQISQPAGGSLTQTDIYKPSDSFIHKYLHGERRGLQPDIVYGRNSEELPQKLLSPAIVGPIFAAFTGPGGGLTSVNRGGQRPLVLDDGFDYIDADDVPIDAAPNAYVTSQPPPPPVDNDLKRSETEEIAGIVNWNRPHEHAFGLSTTLYERHPVTNERAGNPIADTFGLLAREDSAILALADGVNWGEKASVASRCAIHGCLQYLNTALFVPPSLPPTNTTEVFVALLRSFHAAHNLILQEGGMLTTLTAAVVLPLASSRQWVVCVCNVGDSLAYIYSRSHGVREITQGSHDIHSMRDMRDALGALGPVDGQNPELNNLTCSMTFCDQADIVFLTSDGISDNFDPVVGKFAVPKKEGVSKDGGHGARHGTQNEGKRAGGLGVVEVVPPLSGQDVKPSTREIKLNAQARPGAPEVKGASKEICKQPVSRTKSEGVNCHESPPYLPLVGGHQRHELTLLRMEDLLKCALTSCPGTAVTSARGLCVEMIHFATKLTVAKRRILEDPELYSSVETGEQLGRVEQRSRRKKVGEKLSLVPGKLDHASVVAYTVGRHKQESQTRSAAPKTSQATHVLRGGPSGISTLQGSGVPLASPDSMRSLTEDGRNGSTCSSMYFVADHSKIEDSKKSVETASSKVIHPMPLDIARLALSPSDKENQSPNLALVKPVETMV